MAKGKMGVCVFCGVQATVTREHVVPRSLFTDPLPPTMVTVGVCYPCNNGKSMDDLYMRDYLLSDMATQRNPVVQILRQGKLMRSVQKNRSEIARTVMKQARRKPFYSPGGIYLGSPFAAPVETERLESSFGKMVRGLYYHVTRTSLPQDIELTVSRINGFEIQAAWDEMIASGATMNGIHSQVFACQYAIDSKSPFFSRWLLLFCNTILIEVLIIPADGIESLMAEESDASSKLILPEKGGIEPEPSE